MKFGQISLLLTLVFFAQCRRSPVIEKNITRNGFGITEGFTFEPEKSRFTVEVETIVLGVGAGSSGFESITIKKDGHVKVVEFPGDRDALEFSAMAKEISQFFDLSRMEKLKGLQKRYFIEDLNDGTQGFLFLIGGENEKKYVFFDNHFPAEFQEAWHDIAAIIGRIEPPIWSKPIKVDPYSEFRYYQNL